MISTSFRTFFVLSFVAAALSDAAEEESLPNLRGDSSTDDDQSILGRKLQGFGRARKLNAFDHIDGAVGRANGKPHPASQGQNDNIPPFEVLPRKDVPSVDRTKVEAEDRVREASGMAPRFAIPNEVNISPSNGDGVWEVLDDGTNVWRYRIKSLGCNSLNFGFTMYHMPDGGSLFIYDPKTGASMSRAFTSEDNASHDELWTPIIAACDVVIEVNLPSATLLEDLQLTLGYANVGYRGFRTQQQGNSGSRELSGNCNKDVICHEGDDWRKEIPAVAAISTGGYLFCSGFMVNNAQQDRTPFFMTAKHCGIDSGNAASLVVYWNYETSTCGGSPNGNLDQFSTGSSFRADYSPSDFTLVELNKAPHQEVPPIEVTYAGWDRSVTDASSAVAIHHPSVDEKRISFENDPTTITSWYGNIVPGDGTHVRVTDWDLGTTEGGSSGSPLFDQNHHVIGQLHGGSASCTSQTSDWYGRFSVSWNGGGSSNSRLSDWLDPAGTGATYVNTLTLSGTPQSSPSSDPSSSPSSLPSLDPSSEPSAMPSSVPSSLPSLEPSGSPSESPQSSPSNPSSSPSSLPSLDLSSELSSMPSSVPSSLPSLEPSGSPSESPQSSPSDPSSSPSSLPSLDPSSEPSETPSARPSSLPSLEPSGSPSESRTCNGNGTKEDGEECDGLDLGGKSCADFTGLTGGTLICSPSCTFDFSGCDGCGNGVCDGSEDCVSCPSDCIEGTTGAVCGNDICEASDGEDCLSCPADCKGRQSGKPSSRYCCGDPTGVGTDYIGCEQTRCTPQGVSCTKISQSVEYCCGDGYCELGPEDSLNCSTDCGDPPICGDSTCDASSEDQCSCPGDCGTPPANETDCSDGIDNDCDGFVDCNDPNCRDDSACATQQCDSGEVQCSDGSCGVDIKEPCSINTDCCSGNCKKGTCKGSS